MRTSPLIAMESAPMDDQAKAIDSATILFCTTNFATLAVSVAIWYYIRVLRIRRLFFDIPVGQISRP